MKIVRALTEYCSASEATIACWRGGATAEAVSTAAPVALHSRVLLMIDRGRGAKLPRAAVTSSGDVVRIIGRLFRGRPIRSKKAAL
jgi:hypothetical protein